MRSLILLLPPLLLLACGGGFAITDAASLARALTPFLESPEAAKESGRKANALVQSWQGATDRTLRHLGAVLAPPQSQH